MSPRLSVLAIPWLLHPWTCSHAWASGASMPAIPLASGVLSFGAIWELFLGPRAGIPGRCLSVIMDWVLAAVNDRLLLIENTHSTLHLEVLADSVTSSQGHLLVAARRTPATDLTSPPLVSTRVALSDLVPVSTQPGTTYTSSQCSRLLSSPSASDVTCNGEVRQSDRQLYAADVGLASSALAGSVSVTWFVLDARTCTEASATTGRCATMWEGSVDGGTSTPVQLVMEAYFVEVTAVDLPDSAIDTRRPVPGLQAEFTVMDWNGAEFTIASEGVHLIALGPPAHAYGSLDIAPLILGMQSLIATACLARLCSAIGTIHWMCVCHGTIFRLLGRHSAPSPAHPT